MNRLLTVSLLALLVIFLPLDRPAHAAEALKVAIFTDIGTDSDKVLALYRAVAAMGHQPIGITHSDILQGRLTPSNFDVFILPAGEGGERCCNGRYADNAASLGSSAAQRAIRAYLNSGGGMVGIEAGAYFAALNGGTLDVYRANYTWTRPTAAKRTLSITDASFGNGTQEAWQSYGGGYFSVAPNATVIARDTSNRAVIVRAPYNAGRVVLSSFELSLRGDSELDWTIWDNWAMGGTHTHSIGAWILLGRMIQYAHDGTPTAPAIVETPNPTGARIAVVATHTTDGGIAPPLLPSVGRAIEASGNVPLAIRFQEIIDNRLTLSNFKVAFFDGGYAYGLKTGLAGQEQKILNFVRSGGAYWGDCAGAFYAASQIRWSGILYPFPLGIYKALITGPMNDIIAWPNYTLTPVNVSGDPVIGNFGTMQQLYYGGGYFAIPTDAQQGSHVTIVATYAHNGANSGKAAIVRYDYGSGRVVLLGTHLQARPGFTDSDWTLWDNYLLDSTTPLTNPDETWPLFASLLNWAAQR